MSIQRMERLGSARCRRSICASRFGSGRPSFFPCAEPGRAPPWCARPRLSRIPRCNDRLLRAARRRREQSGGRYRHDERGGGRPATLDVRRPGCAQGSHRRVLLEFIAQFEVRTVVMTAASSAARTEGIDYEGSVAFVRSGPIVMARSGRSSPTASEGADWCQKKGCRSPSRQGRRNAGLLDLSPFGG